MVLFFKIFLFFFIGNLFMGTIISILADDPMIDCPANPLIVNETDNTTTGGCQNPNTTFFASRNVTGINATTIDPEAIYEDQFMPINETGGEVEDVFDFVDNIDFLNVAELYEFIKKINPFIAFDTMAALFTAVGVDVDQGMLNAIKGIFVFLGILAFVFVIFKIDVI